MATASINKRTVDTDLSCADLGLPPPQEVTNSRIVITGTGFDDFSVSVTDANHHRHDGSLQHYPTVTTQPLSPGQHNQARFDALEVGRQHLARQCAQLRSAFPSHTEHGDNPFREASCADLGFDPERLTLQAESAAHTDIQMTIRQCQVAVLQIRQERSAAEFKALDGQSCLSQALPHAAFTGGRAQRPAVRSTRLAITGPDPEDVRITAIDRQGRAFIGGGPSGLPALSAAQLRYLAMKHDAAPVFYACLLRLEQLSSQGALPSTTKEQTCEDVHVETYGLPTTIRAFPWTPEHYQLTVITPSGQERRWPTRALPNRSQADTARHVHELAVLGCSIAVNAIFAFFAFSLLVRLPQVRLLDTVFGLAGVLALLLTVPTLWQPPMFGEALGLAYAYALIAGFALFGISLWLPYAAYRQRSLLSSFGTAFVAGAIMIVGSTPLFSLATLGVGLRFIWWVYPVIGLGLAAQWHWFRNRVAAG